MPIFEYQCEECKTKHEVLHKSSLNQEEVSCPKCNSRKNKKLLSTFSASMGGSSYSGSSCTSGNCDLPAPTERCSSGMCGLN
ncbi:MAG TPA: FmdB family zinc ribbon protein [Ignavibacteriaceae bacterium]|nr:FmdB family zinc ribbon protein [Ignavibacteriaceae bacterium]